MEKTSNDKPTLSKEEQHKRSAEQRKLTAPIRKKIENDEKTLQLLTDSLTMIDETLSDVGLYEEARKSELLQLLDRQATIKADIDVIEEQLMSQMMALEALEAQFEE